MDIWKEAIEQAWIDKLFNLFWSLRRHVDEGRAYDIAGRHIAFMRRTR